MRFAVVVATTGAALLASILTRLAGGTAILGLLAAAGLPVAVVALLVALHGLNKVNTFLAGQADRIDSAADETNER